MLALVLVAAGVRSAVYHARRPFDSSDLRDQLLENAETSENFVNLAPQHRLQLVAAIVDGVLSAPAQPAPNP